MTRERSSQMRPASSRPPRARAAERRGEQRRPQATRQKQKEKKGSAVAAMVIAAMVICMTMVVFAIWSAKMAAVSDEKETSGTPVNASLDRGQVGRNGGVGEASSFVQLSDPLLVLVNDQVPVPDDWQVTPAFIGDETVDNRIYQDMTDMFLAAEQENVSFWVCSGYRSQELQETILTREIKALMRDNGMSEDAAREQALRTINRPGFSEHQTGLAIDLNDVSDDFEETEAFRWLQAHAAEYGFVQRYRSDKVEYTGIDNESWHYRYVGKEHAQEMERLDMCLEEYVQYLKDQGVR